EKKIVSDKRIRDVAVAEHVIYRDPVSKSEPVHRVGDVPSKGMKRPVIIGFGPAGMICAYKLAMAGLRPVVIERGQDVDRRMKIVDSFWNTGELDENTNVQFGEGGAGTFSDGKLSTMIHDKAGRIDEFLKILVENGADESILFNAKPHLGTDRLAVIVKNIRNKIIDLGGEVRFGCRLKEIITEKNRIRAVTIENTDQDSKESVIDTDILVLAIGHSARDTFEMLHEKGLMMEQKAFAVGVRVQHPQEMIGFSQYGKDWIRLPAADYKLTYRSERLDRGVYSFCMCPGGFVVNSSSEKGRLVVNGMSNSDRNEPTANSAIIVNVDSRDFDGTEWNAGIGFQRRLEEKAFKECNGKIPVQRYGDLAALLTQTACCKGPQIPNVKGMWDKGDMRNILPGVICDAIMEAFPDFGRKIKGFDDPETLLMGVESRTSSPVRITRNETFEAAGFKGIYPCGEGAGYAGGITSAAVDGIKVYEAILERNFLRLSIDTES
ncbi:MAG: FAD-dependent oxidoreductase, partial [Lachnospiraceae bacterium]|nr:FAD-dependent oxidoreductase [Lachnospiraceae bacterium]